MIDQLQSKLFYWFLMLDLKDFKTCNVFQVTNSFKISTHSVYHTVL